MKSALMVVLALDRICRASLELKRDPILLVHPHAIAPGPIAFQRLQAITRR